MANDVMLPKQYALVLLRKLADDDTFRAHYEQNPGDALRSIGVPADLLSSLPPGHLAPVKLAHKGTFQDALYQVIDDAAGICLCQTPPTLKFSIGESVRPGHGSSTTPFSES